MMHQHTGRSSIGFLDTREILNDIGLKAGDSFLDDGCGDGHFSIAASEIVGGNGKVYAIDIDEEAIAMLRGEISKKGISNIEAIVAEAGNVPVPDETVDVAFMANVLHGLAANGEAEVAMREIARVTKAGGRFSVVEFKKMQSPMGPPLSIRLDPEDVEALAGKHGFMKQIMFEVGQYNYMLILVK
jgi:ubiquinone/menaquinone biosynthesis C-methylase UbiE